MSEKLQVRDVMTAEVRSIGPEATLAEAAMVMIVHGIRALPVINESREVLGLLTDRAVLDHFLPVIAALEEAEAEGGEAGAASEPEHARVREVMRRSVMCVREEQALDEVAALMINKDIERFPVVAEGRLSGFLTRGDVLRRLLGPGGFGGELAGQLLAGGGAAGEPEGGGRTAGEPQTTDTPDVQDP